MLNKEKQALRLSGNNLLTSKEMKVIFLAVALILPSLLLPEKSAGANPLSALRSALCPFHKKAASLLLAPAILEESSEEEMLGLLNLEPKYGPCQEIQKAKGDEGSYRFQLRDAAVTAELRFDRGNHLEDFSFSEAQFLNDNFQKLETSLRKKSETHSLWIETNGEKILGLDETKPLNISRGSSLFLIKALNEAIAKNKAKSSDLIALPSEARTVSFGLLHHWAPGTLLTLDTLKNLVTVENDATAADLLIQALGREQIEAQGRHLKPFLTNRDFARLSDAILPGNAPASREAALKVLDALPDSDGIVDFPDDRYDLVPAVGWFASTQEMCALARSLKDDPSLRHAYRDLRERTASKKEKVELMVETRGAGVAQTTLLFTNGGQTEHCVSFTINAGAPIDDRQVADVIGRAEKLLLKEAKTSDDKH